MPQYKSYLTVKDTKDRMRRKRARTEIFQYNKCQAKKDTKKRLEEAKNDKNDKKTN